MNNAYSAYKKQSVTTMTAIEIVVKLYSETERQLNRAVYFIDQRDYESTHKALVKAQDLINALRSVLDLDIPISSNLDSLYAYFSKEIITADTKKDKTIIETLLPMIGELRDAFSQIAAMPKSEITAQSKQNNNLQVS